jgi:peroxiredoxin
VQSCRNNVALGTVIVYRLPASILASLAICFGSAAAVAADAIVPHLSESGLADYRRYTDAADHRAFAIAPGGAWGWHAGAATREEAEEAALAACKANTRQKCVPYGADGEDVFDAQGWVRLWGPYVSAADAKQAKRGHQVGERFPDIAFADGNGRKTKISDLQGKVVVLHFWGSWCGPCRREMPDMQKLYETLKGRSDLAFRLLQVHESYAVARRWAEAQGLHLPLYDSGAAGESNDVLRLADGEEIRGRDIALSFPTTYVVDKRGIVVFSHIGPVPDWGQYREFLLDAAKRSGR